MLEGTINIEGIEISKDMLRTIADWQNSYGSGIIKDLEELQGLILENWDNIYENKDDTTKIKNSLQCIHSLKNDLRTFLRSERRRE